MSDWVIEEGGKEQSGENWERSWKYGRRKMKKTGKSWEKLENLMATL